MVGSSTQSRRRSTVERQDDLAVLGLLVVAAQQVGDRPDEGRVVADLRVTHLRCRHGQMLRRIHRHTKDVARRTQEFGDYGATVRGVRGSLEGDRGTPSAGARDIPAGKARKEQYKRRVEATREAEREDLELAQQVVKIETTRKRCYDQLLKAGHAIPTWQPIEEMFPDANLSELRDRSTAIRDEWKERLLKRG